MISLGGIVVSQSIRVGGDELDEAIINYAKREYKLLIGQQTAEEVKLEIGSAFPMDEEVQAEIRGRDMVSGLPKTVVLTSEEIRSGARGAGHPDHRRGQGDPRPHATRARVRHHGPRDHACGWRLTAAGPRRAAARGDTDARAPRRVAADLRGGRLRALPGGVRGHPPHEQESNTGAPLAARADTSFGTSRVRSKTVRRRRAVLGLLVACSLILLTAYFGGPPAARSALRAARLQRGLSPVQEGASRALKPVRDLFGWVGDTFDAKGELDDVTAERDSCRQAVLSAGRRARERAAPPLS